MTHLTREQLIATGATTPSHAPVFCPCGNDISRGGVAWGSCRSCAEDVCEECAAIYLSDEHPVFACRGCVEPYEVQVACFVPSEGGDTVFAHCDGKVSGRRLWACCEGGCRNFNAPTLSPCDWNEDETKRIPNGPALCESCSKRLPLLPLLTRTGWPEVTAAQVEGLWLAARALRGAHVRAFAARLQQSRSNRQQKEVA